MRSRLKSLTRVAAVYQVLEHANGASLDRARAELHDAEERIHQREASASRLATMSREALRVGDLNEWLLDQSEIEFTLWNAPALEDIRRRREAAMREAAAIYQASRMQMEQMQRVVDEVRSAVAYERERSEQRAADDRYLSRRRWEMLADERRKDDVRRTAADGRDDSDEPTPMNLS